MSTRHSRRLYWPVAVMLLGAAACGGNKATKTGTGTTPPAEPGTRPTLGTEYDAKVDAVCGGLKGTANEHPATASQACESQENVPPSTQATQGTLPEPEQQATPPSTQATQGALPEPEPEQQATQGALPEPEQPVTPPSTQSSKGTLGDPEQQNPEQAAQGAPEQAAPGQTARPGWQGSQGRLGEPEQPAAPEQTNDQKVANLLAAMNNVEVTESQQLESKAQSQAVRDFAHMMVVSHNRGINDNQTLFKKLSIKIDENAMNRGIEGGFLQGLNAANAQTGAELDREYMRRQIMEHQRAIELIDELLPKTDNVDLHCALQQARNDSMNHLEQACYVWSTLKSETATAGPGKVITHRRQGSGPAKVNPRPHRGHGVDMDEDGEL